MSRSQCVDVQQSGSKQSTRSSNREKGNRGQEENSI